jgi:hypothetical protein
MAVKEGLIRAALPPLLKPFQGAAPYGSASRQSLSNPRVIVKAPEKEGLIRAALPPLLERALLRSA